MIAAVKVFAIRLALLGTPEARLENEPLHGGPISSLLQTRNGVTPNMSGFWTLISEERQKPQPPLLLTKVLQYASHLYCNTPPICIAVLLVPLCSEESEMLSVLLPFVSQYAPHLYCNTPPICIAVLLGKSWWLWSPGCSPLSSVSPFLLEESSTDLIKSAS